MGPNLKSIFACCLCALLAPTSSVFAQDRVPLWQLTTADRAYINRAHSYAEAVCLNELIDEIEAYGGPLAMHEFTINLDDGQPTSVTSITDQITHTCSSGQLIMRDTFGTHVLQIYDDDGNPTMMEP